MTTWMDQIFEGAPVPPWLRHFEREPVEALHELLLGISPLGHLAAADPEQLLLDWLEALGTKNNFAHQVDEALTIWIGRSWSNPLLGPAPASAARTALAWCRAADVIAVDFKGELKQSVVALRTKVTSDRYFLDALAEGTSRDPLGHAWLALARHQDDRSLAAEWWQLCHLPPNTPWHRGAYGIHGLRGLPSSLDATHEEGGFPAEVAEGLVQLGIALARRADERWLRHEVARDEFLRTARLTAAAYPMPEMWAAFWDNAFQKNLANSTVGTWLRALSSASTAPKSTTKYQAVNEPYWQPLAQSIAQRLAQGGAKMEEAIEQATGLLRNQQTFAEITGDGRHFARSACNFASKIRSRYPELALSWVRLARRFDPWNPYTWTEETATLVASGHLDDALRIAWEATERFPDDDVSHNDLADILLAQGKLNEAEAQFRLNQARFPHDVFAYTGLTRVLLAQGRLVEAEAQFQLALTHFPDDNYALKGLETVQTLLSASGSTPISAKEPPPVSQVVKAQAASPSALLDPPLQAPPSQHLSSDEIEIILTNAGLVRRWARGIDLGLTLSPGALRDRARGLLQRLAMADFYDSRAAGERGLLTLAEGEVENAVTLLREAVRRFPGSARVRYALARAERQRAIVEQRHLDPAKPDALTSLWRQLERIDPIYRPVHLLGEGRTWLAQLDGSTVEDGARKAFGQLGFWLHNHIDRTDVEAPNDKAPAELRGRFKRSTNTFVSWWALEVQVHLFGMQDVKRAEDLDSLDPIKEQLNNYAPMLDTLEESWISRHAMA
jgi:tetratricopeptide (TPR) repeat protein